MPEKNKHTLREALNRLPEHEAPADAWAGITGGLSPTLADRLPTHQPPAGVWNSLSRKLEAEATTAPVTKRRRLPVRMLMGAAATIALLLTVGLGLVSGFQHQQSITVAYSQEVAPARSIDVNEKEIEKEDEKRFQKVIAEIEARNEPGLNALHHELVELTEAKEYTKAMLVSYGEDPTLIRQLAEIERGRSDIYRRIIEL